MRSFARARAIGDGAYGAVVVLYDAETGEECAGKIFEKEDSGEASAETLREILILKRLSGGHENIIDRVDFSTDLGGGEPDLFMVMPLLKGDLASYMMSFAPRQKLSTTRGMLRGIDFLHRNNVFHRDLKPENVLLTEDDTPKIIDFSLSKWISKTAGDVAAEAGGAANHAAASKKKKKPPEEKKKKDDGAESRPSTEACGTVCYIPPQQIRKQNYSSLCDIWSAGVIVLEMFQNKRLEAERDKAALKAVAEARERLNKEKPVPLLLRGMLAEEEVDRLSAAQCLASPAFACLEEGSGSGARAQASGADELRAPAKCAKAPRAEEPIGLFPHARFAKNTGSAAMTGVMRKLARQLDYEDSPTGNAAIFYAELCAPPHLVCSMHFAAKVFEPETLDLQELEEIFSDFDADDQKAYELALLRALDFDLLSHDHVHVRMRAFLPSAEASAHCPAAAA
jgi:hypothetical protein